MTQKEKREWAKETVSSHLARMRSEGKCPSVHVTTFGCHQNEADSERLYGMAFSLGYEKATSPEAASLILLKSLSNLPTPPNSYLRQNRTPHLYTPRTKRCYDGNPRARVR